MCDLQHPCSTFMGFTVMKSPHIQFYSCDIIVPPPQVNFNEPLSFLQRMVEDLVYSDILEKAARCETTMEELAHLAGFAISPFAAVALPTRMNKCFNPLLGETYECDRRAEYGWRCILEQVQKREL